MASPLTIVAQFLSSLGKAALIELELFSVFVVPFFIGLVVTDNLGPIGWKPEGWMGRPRPPMAILYSVIAGLVPSFAVGVPLLRRFFAKNRELDVRVDRVSGWSKMLGGILGGVVELAFFAGIVWLSVWSHPVNLNFGGGGVASRSTGNANFIMMVFLLVYGLPALAIGGIIGACCAAYKVRIHRTGLLLFMSALAIFGIAILIKKG